MGRLCFAAFCLLNIAATRISDASKASRTMPSLQLIPESSTIMMGDMASVRCVLKNVSLPVTFTLFLNGSTKGIKTVSEDEEATFNVTISDSASLGMYKCKANNSASNGTYSNGFRFALPGTMPKPELVPKSSNVAIGRTVNIQCRSRNASLPVTFTLFLNNSTKGRKTASEVGEATFNVTISDPASLGAYKCKGNNSASNGTYSNGFTFVLQELTTHGPGAADTTGGGQTLLAWLIPLLVLAVIIAAFVFWRFGTCKPAARREEIWDNNTYENMSAARGTERCAEKEGEVAYCTVILTEDRRDRNRAAQTSEYVDIADTRLQAQQQ